MIRRAVKEDIPQIENLLYQIQKIHSDKRPDIFRQGQKKIYHRRPGNVTV